MRVSENGEKTGQRLKRQLSRVVHSRESDDDSQSDDEYDQQSDDDFFLSPPTKTKKKCKSSDEDTGDALFDMLVRGGVAKQGGKKQLSDRQDYVPYQQYEDNVTRHATGDLRWIDPNETVLHMQDHYEAVKKLFEKLREGNLVDITCIPSVDRSTVWKSSPGWAHND